MRKLTTLLAAGAATLALLTGCAPEPQPIERAPKTIIQAPPEADPLTADQTAEAVLRIYFTDKGIPASMHDSMVDVGRETCALAYETTPEEAIISAVTLMLDYSEQTQEYLSIAIGAGVAAFCGEFLPVFDELVQAIGG